MSFHGADTDQLRSVAADLDRKADEFRQITDRMRNDAESLEWAGQDAEAFRRECTVLQHRGDSGLVASIRDLASRLRHNAVAQDEVSASLASHRTGADGQRSEDPLHPIGTSEQRFGFGNKGHQSGRLALADALRDMGDGIGDTEISIRELDNGKFMVVLPGVVDGGVDVLNMVSSDPSGTVRDTSNAVWDVVGGGGLYAERVKGAMQAYGVPPGSDVMFVGHSHGAYAAVDLAGDASFNSADPTGGYHVNVTHVAAVGAETDWMTGSIPESTDVLVLNNRYDNISRVESIVADPADDRDALQGANVTEVVFNGPIGGVVLAEGHNSDVYAKWVTEADDRSNLNAFLDDVGNEYSGAGTKTNVGVLE